MLEGDPPKKNHEIREFWEQNLTILEPPESRFSELPGVFSLSLSLWRDIWTAYSNFLFLRTKELFYGAVFELTLNGIANFVFLRTI